MHRKKTPAPSNTSSNDLKQLLTTEDNALELLHQQKLWIKGGGRNSQINSNTNDSQIQGIGIKRLSSFDKERNNLHD